MTLADISTWIYQAVRAKLHPEQIILIMDAVQRMAFENNSKSFLVWTENLTPQFVLSFSASGYTSAVTGDIGKSVVGAASGATGTLISYDNTAKTWNITTGNDTAFTEGEAVSITTGTGAGTVDDFSGYIGPYDAPSDPPVRKIWGITTETDGRIYGTDDATAYPMNDFDFQGRTYNASAFFKPGRENNLDHTFTFSESPSLSTTYRWVYWRTSPTISGTDDNTSLLIPETYHMAFINACVKMAQITLSGEDVDPRAIQAFFTPWYDTLSRPYTPMGYATNQTLNPRGRADSFL